MFGSIQNWLSGLGGWNKLKKKQFEFTYEQVNRLYTCLGRPLEMDDYFQKQEL